MRREGLRRISRNCQSYCGRIEWWIGSTSIIGRRSLRPSSQSSLLSSRSSGGLSHYYAGFERSLNTRLKADPIKKSGSVQGCANRRGSAIIAGCRGGAFHHHGQLKMTTLASSCAMRMGRRSATSTSRKTMGDVRQASYSPKMRREESL